MSRRKQSIAITQIVPVPILPYCRVDYFIKRVYFCSIEVGEEVGELIDLNEGFSGEFERSYAA